METLNSSTLSEKMLNEGKVHCYECKVGYYKPLTPNCKKNYCFICDNCGDRLTVEPNVQIV